MFVLAWPWTLGYPIPDPPPGYAYLLDDEENFLTDDLGALLTVPWSGI